MDRIEEYRQILKDVIAYHAQFHPIYGEMESQQLIDETGNHYQLLYVGWEDQKRVHGHVLHLELKADGKIWIQHDGIEYGVAHDLLERGVPKTDIVLAFYPEFARVHTDFAVV